MQKFVVEAMGVTAAILPYEELDQRALDYIHYTRAENAETVADDVDRYNDRMQKDSIKSAQNEFEDEFSHEMRLTKEEFVSGSLPTPSGANGGDRV
ncbi:MAG: hypothetical protein IJ735_00575 [Clostridia bacterium]|nr:hypothetical protein [Clostridia bacterium]